MPTRVHVAITDANIARLKYPWNVGTHMAKKVANAVDVVQRQRFGMDKKVRFVGCDDGCTYVFVRPADGRRWRPRERIDADGGRAVEPSRLPRAVEAHMDGVTQSGPEGIDSQEYLA